MRFQRLKRVISFCLPFLQKIFLILYYLVKIASGSVLIFFLIWITFILYNNHLTLKNADTPQVKILQKAAQHDDVAALIKLAQLYEESRYDDAYSLSPLYNKKIFQLYKRAAELGNSTAQHELAMRYYNGLGCPINYKEGIEWDKKAAAQGNLDAKLVLGSVYTDNYARPENTFVDLKQALYWYKQAAEQGSALGNYRLGMVYYYGIGVSVDYQKALFYMNKAVNSSAPPNDAEAALGNFYEACRVSFFCSLDKARYWYNKAAQHHNQIGQYNLAVFYEQGRGGVQDYQQARYWYQQAENQSSSEAALALGDLYQEGKGGSVDYQEAKKHYETASWYSEPMGDYKIGLLYEYGYGTPKDRVKADEYYKKSRELYFARTKNVTRNDGLGVVAEYMIGVFNQYGRGEPKNIHTAIEWWEKAANHGLAQASLTLGTLYLNGKEVPKDLVRAKIWLTKADQQGSIEAKKLLATLSKR